MFPLGTARTAYLVLAGPLPLIAPASRFRGTITSDVAWWCAASSTARAISSPSAPAATTSACGARRSGAAVASIRCASGKGEYVVALTNEALAVRQDIFDGFARAVRVGDVESAYLLSVQAQASAMR
jgi:hypothetical protein